MNDIFPWFPLHISYYIVTDRITFLVEEEISLNIKILRKYASCGTSKGKLETIGATN